MALLTVEDLRVRFHTREGVVRAVDGVSFAVEPGACVGIVGESGSGKSAAMLGLLGLLPSPPARVEAARAMFEGRDLAACSAGELRALRGRRAAMIFQDPMTALNPYMRVGAQLMEPLRVHEGVSRQEAARRAAEALAGVGLPDPWERMRAYPHEFSGGMRQRVMIAMALIARPPLLIADEPTTALDVTVQAQILDLMDRRRRELGMAVILITHDLGVVARVCDRVHVMYAGRFLESASAEALFARPRHPYTTALLESLPAMHARGAPLHTIPGMPPDLIDPVEGCPFAPRCAHAVAACRVGGVELRSVGPDRASACIRVQEGEL